MGVESFLLDAIRNPAVFLPLLFAFSVATALILPLPIEIALLPFITDPPMYGVAVLVMGSGKAAGSWLVFILGLEVENTIRNWSRRFRFVRVFVGLCTRFVARTQYLGLFALLATPFMSDTVPLYAYSVFNHQGSLLEMRYFVFTNFLAGVDRGIILFVILLALGINLFA
jgi:membrane protein YqaA with SNARE-associated domain